MHAKSDSEVTSVEQSTPPRSPRRPIYYVQSPSNHDVEKMSYGSSPAGSPAHHFYHCSPIHHSRESSTSRFSASLKNPRSLSAWRKLQRGDEVEESDDDDDENDTAFGKGGPGRSVRLYFCFALLFVVLFTAFSLILWGASKAYEPQVIVKSIVFESFEIQAGSDRTGVPTDMLSLNSTVRIHYRNPATFFGVHVTSTPLELHYYQLKVASGQIENFYQARKTHRTIRTVVLGSQVALYGGVSVVQDVSENRQRQRVAVPLNLTFVVRSRAYILGKLVKSKFYERIRCSVTLRGSNLGKHSNLTNSCVYE
ncbi:PREDICTED: uncharacterized protein LOC103334887 [Prunus mume]|uniref:Uncharacterized protein LOC103334887 n=1 Tax=Prunus mume TaxID=102107 RepID=A0ABM0P922_PRUMU|nr:PREDICTED: uncharacterized protein LOC103334887 [Prunus mume]